MDNFDVNMWGGVVPLPACTLAGKNPSTNLVIPLNW